MEKISDKISNEFSKIVVGILSRKGSDLD